MAQRGREIEIKLPVPDARIARRILRAAGFHVSKRRVFELNIVFDTSDGALRNSGTLLRVREAGPLVTLTYKGRAEAGRHKSREEIETQVSDARSITAIFDRLGFHPQFRYEKYRTEFQRPHSRGVATIDETPIGVYLELEGSPRWIDQTARALGFAEKDYILDSYGRLYFDACGRDGVAPSNMVF